ncbi:outer membrane beta-barrel protein [Vibrio ulleungensis]|uniref:Outer membrane beta-barrel protein n=1 Tax=Vibrio ulleungensis TaxID=2807619 RepID=A0ABS2HDD3_9VIBR|nr:outer membrane beta-barrel protein [Vibrio ulleungensis]MBM7035081.1 outer membrane beta-barrel protein [Vibrio ulleungensis]
MTAISPSARTATTSFRFTVLALMLGTATLAAFSAQAATERYRDNSTPVNYNYAQLGVQGFSMDGADSTGVALTGGGENMLSEHWIVGSQYKGTSASNNSYFEDTDFDSDQIDASLKYRFAVAQNTDVLVGADLGYAWQKVKFENLNKTYSDNDFVYGGDVELRQGFGDHWEAGVGLGLSNSFDNTSMTLSSNADYYFNTHFGLGVIADYVAGGDAPDSTSVGMETRFLF